MHQRELFPETVRVVRIDPDQNMRRFYRLHLQPDLFGGVCLLREWGRIGTAGRTMMNRYDDAGQAADALLDIYRSKCKRGYRLTA